VLEDKYRRTHAPFVALAFAAAATKELIVGTSVCLVIEHDPIVLAKEISSLDLLSGGRFVFGVGAGWNKQEMLNHGTDPATRHGNMREARGGHARDLDDRGGGVPRQARGLRSDLAVAEARVSPTGLHRRQRPARRGPRAALRRRLDAEHEGSSRRSSRASTRCASARSAHVPEIYYGATPRISTRLRDAGVDAALIVLPSGSEADVLASITLVGVSDEPVLRIHQTRSRANPGGMDVKKVPGRGRPALPQPQAGVVQGPRARQREVPELSKRTIADEGLHTVCKEAACPNVGDCWERGTARS
jgi:hypothetical protein